MTSCWLLIERIYRFLQLSKKIFCLARGVTGFNKLIDTENVLLDLGNQKNINFAPPRPARQDPQRPWLLI